MSTSHDAETTTSSPTIVRRATPRHAPERSEAQTLASLWAYLVAEGSAIVVTMTDGSDAPADIGGAMMAVLDCRADWSVR